MPITILGLGPGAWEHLTVEAQGVLVSAREVYLRTSRHPIVSQLPPSLQVHSFDHLYEEKATFAEVYRAIADRVLGLGRLPEGVIYAVPGHPMVGEESVQIIRREAAAEHLEVRLIAGLSFLEPVLAAAGVDPLAQGLQVVDALAPRLDPALPAVVCQLYDRRVAAGLKTFLLELYPPEHPAKLVSQAGLPGQRVEDMPLYQIDRRPTPDHLTCLYLPPLPWQENLGSFSTVVDVVARLRGPGGCPWDREQTHASIKENLLEECYETLEALDAEDSGKLAEELGDLLLQILLHAQIASEVGEFSIRDVVQSIAAKLVRRHPHVFGDVQVADAQQVLSNWEAIKRGERVEGASMLSGVPRAMPALAYAQAVQKRAARVGFDWPSVEGVRAKVAEEMGELEAASSPEERRHEYGDLIFALVNYARWLDIDAEESLRLANLRFTRRFASMERRARAGGRQLGDLTLDELNALWEQAKRELE